MKMIKELLYVDKSKYKRECDYLIAKCGVWLKLSIIISLILVFLNIIISADYNISLQELDLRKNSLSTLILVILSFFVSFVGLLGAFGKIIKKSIIFNSVGKRRVLFNRRMFYEFIFSIVSSATFYFVLDYCNVINAYVGSFVLVCLVYSISLLWFGLAHMFTNLCLGVMLKYLRLKRKYCKIIKDEND
jgi:hypothetical protein